MKHPVRLLIALAPVLGLMAGPAVSATKIQKTFETWQVECNESDQGKKACGLYTAYVNSQNKAVVLGWTIGRDEKSNADKLIVRTLTGIDVSAGITVQFDGAKPVVIPFKVCMPQYCFAEVPFSDAWKKALTGAEKFVVAYKAANGADVKQEVVLKGFSDAYKFYSDQLQA